jgi:hypothetical protein
MMAITPVSETTMPIICRQDKRSPNTTKQANAMKTGTVEFSKAVLSAVV